MPELRLALIGLGIVLVLAVYLYSRWQSARNQGRQPHGRRGPGPRQRPSLKEADLPSIDPASPARAGDAGRDSDAFSAEQDKQESKASAPAPDDARGAGQDPSRSDAIEATASPDETRESAPALRAESEEDQAAELPRVEHGGRRTAARETAASALSGLKAFARGKGEATSARKTDAQEEAAPTDPEPVPAGEATEPSADALASFDPDSQKIIAMHVLARGEEGMDGARLRQVLETAGTRHGQYNIFHRSERDALGQPRLFLSVANMLEPGYFDLDTMDEECYRGVSLFAVLPGPLPGIKTFHEMLSLAQTVAEEVNGEVCDEARNPFSRQRATYIEEEITEFERLRRQSRARGRGARR